MDEIAGLPRRTPPLRPEREVTPELTGRIGDVARPLTLLERLANMTLVRRLAVDHRARRRLGDLCAHSRQSAAVSFAERNPRGVLGSPSSMASFSTAR